jgi:hypothetical protein
VGQSAAAIALPLHTSTPQANITRKNDRYVLTWVGRFEIGWII